MLLGATFLVRSPLTPGGVSVGVALVATIPFALFTVFLVRLVLKSRKWKSSTGREELLGEQGVVTTAGAGRGRGNDSNSWGAVARQFEPGHPAGNQSPGFAGEWLAAGNRAGRRRCPE